MTRLQRSLRPRDAAGFTLIELLVVIVILGILSAVVVFAVRGTGDKGKESAVTIDARTIRTAEEGYCAKFGRYADGPTLVAEGFLSEEPEYHRVFARQSDGPCNGWEYSVLRTAEAGAYAAGTWASAASPPSGIGTVVFLVGLLDGRVLAGGINSTFDGPAAAIWDPAVDTWATVDPHPEPFPARMAPSAMLLRDDPSTPDSECASPGVDNCGKVLYREKFLFDPEASAGSQWQTLSPPATCYICNEFTFSYDPRSMAQIKGMPTACGTVCGGVLMVGGNQGGGTPNGLLFNPRNNSYTDISFNGVDALETHSHLVALTDGRVLLCCTTYASDFDQRADFFDPLTLTFTSAPNPPSRYDRGSFNQPFVNPEPAPVLPNGEIFLGREFVPPGGSGYTGTAGIYTPDPSGPGSWRTVAPCSTTEGCEVIGSLPDGRVLSTDWNYTKTYVFNPATEQWDASNDLNNSSSFVAGAVLLAGPGCGPHCGKMFIVGNQSAELYTP